MQKKIKESLVIISNDRFNYRSGYLSYENKNTLSIIEGLLKKYEIFIIARKKSKNLLFKKKINNLKFINFFGLLKIIIKKRIKFFFISITPFNFFIFSILKIFCVKKKRIITFLRSDGFKEYKKFFLGELIYLFFFVIFREYSLFLSCSKYLNKIGKHELVLPSEIDKLWLSGVKKKILKNKLNILYVGRFKKEKGVYSLLKLFRNLKLKDTNLIPQLTMVGYNNLNIKKKYQYVKFVKYQNNSKKLISIYDKNDVFVLPSYTEAYPQVILESLSRKKPVIIFEEIKFIKQNFPFGIFVSKRNNKDFSLTLKKIVRNYNTIVKKIDSKKLQTKKNYYNQLHVKLKKYDF